MFADDIKLYVKCTDNIKFEPDIIYSMITTIKTSLTLNSLIFNITKADDILLHLPLRSKTLPKPPPISEL